MKSAGWRQVETAAVRVSSADTVPVLMAFDAEVRIVSSKGDRWEPIGNFYRDDGLVPTTLQLGEIVAEVRLPPAQLRVVYDKLRVRMSFDFPLVGAATGIGMDSAGRVCRARVVLTAVGAHPFRVREAEHALVGNQLSPGVIQAAGEAVFHAARPMDNTEGSIPHRKRMARVYVERALRQFSGLETA